MSSYSRDALEDRVAIVTGAASGIGRATALTLARSGACIALIDRSAVGLAETDRLVRRDGGSAQSFEADLGATTSIGDVVGDIVTTLGRPFILVNVAGISRSDVWSIEDTTEEILDEVGAVNFKAPLSLIKHVARCMSDGGGGRIVNVTSSAAFRGQSPVAYSTSKAALVQLTRIAAAELGCLGVNVNSVAPGLTRTPMTERLGVGQEFDRAAREGPLATLLGRPAEPADIANVIVFLCLPESQHITGQTIHVSGGNIV